jgi:hypothetical protein
MQKYRVKIKDMSQPMLISVQKRHHISPGQDSLIYLVPELCCMTGLSDRMQKNFSLMKNLASCTRLAPSQRMERLQHFNRCLKTNSMVSYCNILNNVSHWNVDIFWSDNKMIVIILTLKWYYCPIHWNLWHLRSSMDKFLSLLSLWWQLNR